MDGWLLWATSLGGLALLSWGLYEALFAKQLEARKTIEARLEDASPTEPLPKIQPKPPNKEDSILKKRHKDETHWRFRLEQKLERANLLMRVNEFLLVCVASALVSCVFLGWACQTPWGLAFLLAPAGGFLPVLGLNLKVWWRMNVARQQFPEILDTMVNCFKTGYGFNRAVQQVADNFKDPWGTEFGKMALETSLGANMEETLTNLAYRVPNPDVDLFVTSMLIQKDTGGNLTELLGNLSHTCRERFKLIRKVAAISAQGKLTAIIVSLVPLMIMGFMYLFMGAAVLEFVSNIIGQIILGLTMCWMTCGVVVLWKLVQIEV